ncbi:MAG: ribonuclease Z [Muribaculaceae bacterium]|nr:ribonuclease Z [Muribaculaceae bacterium]
MSNSSLFKVHTLGCGSAKPSPHHNTSCTVVEHNSSLYMIDCGEGAQKAFAQKKLKLNRLSHIFLTHLHGDHVFGLPGLIGTLGLQDKGGSITIHTFAEGEKILTQIFEFFDRDTPFEIKFNILNPHKEEIALETRKLRVRTVPLKHRINCVGYVFEEKEKPRHIIREMCDFHKVPVWMMNSIKMGSDFQRDDGVIVPNHILTRDPTPAMSYAHIGDTSYSSAIAGKVGPVELLMHETTYLEDLRQMASERGHSTARQAALFARESGAKHLLTGHYSSRYNDDSLFLKEAKEVFPNTILNKEGLTLSLPIK